MGSGRRRRTVLVPIGLALLGRAASASPQAATASLEVTVHRSCPGPADAAIAGVDVTLSCPGDRRTTTTDARGTVWFPHLRAQTCRVEATPPGAHSVADVELLPGVAHAQAIEIPGDCQDPAAPPPAVRRTADALTLTDAGNIRRAVRPTDVWSVLRDVPGVVVDRVDVGGSETAQQSLLVSHADLGAGATWTLDGADITDPAALGAVSFYPDVDALAYVQARTSATDVRVRTPGLQVGLHLREPGNRRSGGLRIRGSAGALQSDNLPDDLRGRPFFRNRTDHQLEYGGELGGPVKRDGLWLWGAVSRQAITQETFTEHEERLRTTSIIGKGRLRLGGGTLSLLALRAEKTHDDRDTTPSAAPDARWRQSGPVHLASAEDQHTWRGVSLLGRVSYLDADFRLTPQGGPDASPFEDFQGVFRGSYARFDTQRPRVQAGLEAATRRRFLGRDHELVAGLGYQRSPVTTHLEWPGNRTLALERQSLFFRTFRLTGFALPTRDQHARSVTTYLEAYVQDTVRLGPFTATLGLRLDRQAGRNLASTVDANPVFPDLLPAVAYPGGSERIRWLDLLPRASVAWENQGSSRRLVVRAGYAAYGARLGAVDVTFDNPLGRDASLTYYWLDRNGDHEVQAGELDLLRGLLASVNVDPKNPSSAISPHVVDPDLRSPRTHEGSLTVEQGFGRDFTASLRFTVRRAQDVLWRPLRNLTLGDYVVRSAVRGQLFGRPYSVGVFGPASESRIVPGNGRVLANRPGYHQDSVNLDLAVRARAGRVRIEAWLGLADARERFDDDAGLQDPTPLDAEPLQHNGRIAARPGGLGRGDVFVNARWTAGVDTWAPLPWGLETALHVYARDGFPIPYFQVGASGDPTAGAKNVLVSPHLDSYRLPTVFLLDVRLARAFTVRGGRLSAEVDVFNALNRATTLQVARDVELPSVGRPREILRPRIVRLGLRYDF
jgi:hypothetical protein